MSAPTQEGAVSRSPLIEREKEETTLFLAKSMLGAAALPAILASLFLFFVARGALQTSPEDRLSTPAEYLRYWSPWSAFSLTGLILYFFTFSFICHPRGFRFQRVLWISCAVFLGGSVLQPCLSLWQSFQAAFQSSNHPDLTPHIIGGLLLLIPVYAFALAVALCFRPTLKAKRPRG